MGICCYSALWCKCFALSIERKQAVLRHHWTLTLDGLKLIKIFLITFVEPISDSAAFIAFTQVISHYLPCWDLIYAMIEYKKRCYATTTSTTTIRIMTTNTTFPWMKRRCHTQEGSTLGDWRYTSVYRLWKHKHGVLLWRCTGVSFALASTCQGLDDCETSTVSSAVIVTGRITTTEVTAACCKCCPWVSTRTSEAVLVQKRGLTVSWLKACRHFWPEDQTFWLYSGITVCV